jgi:hypothetical protein
MNFLWRVEEPYGNWGGDYEEYFYGQQQAPTSFVYHLPKSMYQKLFGTCFH